MLKILGDKWLFLETITVGIFLSHPYSGVPLSLKMYNCSRKIDAGGGNIQWSLALTEVTFWW